jgi:general stress protein 26
VTDPQPRATRATFPSDYGPRGGPGDEPLDWVGVEALLRQAPNYWIATTGPDGRPHARPVDGVWVLGTLCFGGSPDTRWVRNLTANPSVGAHLPSGDDVVILEGTAAFVDDQDDPLAAASAAANREKYPQYFNTDDPSPAHPFWVLRPRVAYAWSLTGFPHRATRWDFG